MWPQAPLQAAVRDCVLLLVLLCLVPPGMVLYCGLLGGVWGRCLWGGQVCLRGQHPPPVLLPGGRGMLGGLAGRLRAWSPL